MKKIIPLAVFILIASTSASWAWGRGGYGGWHGGGWGRGYGYHGGISVGIGVPGPWWGYPDYAYDPYYPYYAPPAPYAAVPVYADPPPAYPSGDVNSIPDPEASESAAPAPDTTRTNLKTFNNALAKARERLDYQYADGDISKAQEEGGLRYLDQVAKEAHDQADANGGYITREQEQDLLQAIQHPNSRVSRPQRPTVQRSVSQQPPAPANMIPESSSGGDLTAVNDLLLELRSLLDEKLKEGAITKTQKDAEAGYLARIEKEAQSDAGANGGHLTSTQENKLTQQLHQAYYAINHNLIVH